MNPFHKDYAPQNTDNIVGVDFSQSKPSTLRSATTSNNTPSSNNLTYILKDQAIPTEVRIGYWTIAIFLGLLLSWVASIPLTSGAIAPGVVSVDGDSKVVQHLKGGRVKQILVKDGDLVQKGKTLIELDKTELQAKYNSLESVYILLLARESRLRAESRGLAKITFSKWLLDRMDDAQVVEATNNQQRIFQSNLDLLHEKEITNKYRIRQAQTLMLSDQARLSTTNQRANSVNSELTQYQQLLAKGLVTRNQTFSLQNSKSEIINQVTALKGSINLNRSKIAQYQAEISEYKMLQKNNAIKELDNLQDDIASTRKELTTTSDLLMQASIKAPIDGYIVDMETNTVGGIIAPGQKIMGIVPNNKRLIINARVDAKDRDSIKIGQNAEIRFSAFNRRTTMPVNGKVTMISADRTVDPITQTSYYNTKIEMLENPKIKLHGATIHPGMLAGIIIQTGERTVLDYFLAPVASSFDRAMKEK